jgi:branched-chain amino acid transport system substrate-binding protein
MEESGVTRSRSTLAIAIAIGALLAALVLSACGGDSSSSTAADTTEAGATSQEAGGNEPQGSPLRIALIVNASGPLPSGEETAVPVSQAWERSVNAEGGVAGHPVEIVVEDTKGDPPTATSEVQGVTKDQSIVAGIMFDAATEGIVAEEITKAGLPVIGGMGYAPEAWGTMPNWLPLTTSIPSIFNMGMVLGKSLGGTRSALTICAEIAGCAAAAPVVKNASEKEGMAFTGTYKISSSAPDYTAECLSIKEKETDYVMLGAATTSAALRLAKDCGTQGYEGQWGLFGGVIYPKVMRENDPGTKLALALNSFPWFAEAPPVASYREMMEGEGVEEDTWGDLHGTAAYATLELMRKTLDENEATLPSDPTREDIIAAYGSVKNETLEGLLPQPITFHPNKPNAPVTCYWFGSYENGVFSEGDLEHPVCDPPSLQES